MTREMSLLRGRKREWKIIQIVALLVLLVAVVKYIPLVWGLLILVIISLAIAYLLDPVVVFLEGRGTPRSLAVLIVLLAIGLLVGLSLRFVVPAVIIEIRSFSKAIETGQAKQVVAGVLTTVKEKVPMLPIDEWLQKLDTVFSGLLKGFFAFLLNVLSFATTFIIVPFVVFFLLKDEQQIKKGLISLVPNRYFEMALNLLHKVECQLTQYVQSQIIRSLVVTFLTILGLWLLKISYFVFLGIFAGLANIIPFFGPFVALIVAVVVTAMKGGTLGAVLGVVFLYLFVQLVDNIIAPLIAARSAKLHPLLVFLIILAGGKLLGVVGMLIAVPFAIVIKVAATEMAWGFKNYRLE